MLRDTNESLSIDQNNLIQDGCRQTYVCRKILVLRQDPLGLTSQRSFDDLLVGVSVEMVGGEVRGDPVALLPILHTGADSDHLPSHIRAWDEIGFPEIM